MWTAHPAVPQLAIHLSEERKGVQLDPQRHLNAVWGTGSEPRSFIGFLADEAGVAADAVLGWELMTTTWRRRRWWARTSRW